MLDVVKYLFLDSEKLATRCETNCYSHRPQQHKEKVCITCISRPNLDAALSGTMMRQVGKAGRQATQRPSHADKARPSSTSMRSPAAAMLRPGAVDLPQSAERSVPLAAVAHSLQVDARRQFAAAYEDITQYMDKCEYLFDHDEFYDTSYKSLARTVTQLNKVGTDAQQQEREQLYTGLLDWLNTSSFSLDAPTHGVINEHQLIESAQTTRDVSVKMLLSLERLRALQVNGKYYLLQGRNHVFKVGGPIPWSTLLYRTKYGWYTQFRALQCVS